VNENPQGPGRGRGSEPEEILEEEELEDEDQADVITAMNKVTWLEIVLIQGDHGALTAEPTDMQLKTAQS
jgi:hypothetical protein